MRLEAERIVVDWLKHASFGVNAYLPNVPRDAGDPAPPLVATWDTDDLAVFDETRHVWVAEKKDPPAIPAIYVMVEGGVEMTGEPIPSGQLRLTKSPIAVVIRYITANSDRVASLRDGEYTLRAVVRSLRELMRNDNEASRTRNSVCLTAMVDPVLYAPIIEAVGNSRTAGAVGAEFEARDLAPSF